jgi:hypothetical protein
VYRHHRYSQSIRPHDDAQSETFSANSLARIYPHWRAFLVVLSSAQVAVPHVETDAERVECLALALVKGEADQATAGGTQRTTGTAPLAGEM